MVGHVRASELRGGEEGGAAWCGGRARWGQEGVWFRAAVFRGLRLECRGAGVQVMCG